MEEVRRVDVHALIPRFAPLRLHDAAGLGRLAASIERQGQLMPVVAVADPDRDRHWVLIDGYRRLEALRRLGADRIWVDIWARSVDEALLACLARGPERAWAAIEEAALIEELSNRHSLHTIARRLGRDVSWVSRRLGLIKALPEELLEQVREGRISLWAATRILAPLARANSEHARTLLEALAHQPLSTRELKRLYGQYREASKIQRARLVAHPTLFLQALERREQDRAERRLAEGPEGAWCQDLAVVGAILKRLRLLIPRLFAPSQDPHERARLARVFAPAKAQFQRLEQALAEVAGRDPG
jgi:ParB/RepB/Spo0J family partition protein